MSFGKTAFLCFVKSPGSPREGMQNCSAKSARNPVSGFLSCSSRQPLACLSCRILRHSSTDQQRCAPPVSPNRSVRTKPMKDFHVKRRARVFIVKPLKPNLIDAAKPDYCPDLLSNPTSPDTRISLQLPLQSMLRTRAVRNTTLCTCSAPRAVGKPTCFMPSDIAISSFIRRLKSFALALL